MTDLREILAAATPGPWRMWVGSVCRIGPTPEGAVIDSEMLSTADARLIALAPDLAAEVLALREENAKLGGALEPFSRMAGEMFAANWNDDGVAISFITKNGPLRLTFKEFRAARAAIRALEEQENRK